jgi:transposase
MKKISKIREAVRLLLETNYSNRAISRQVDLSHTTIAKYRKILLDINLSWSEVKVMDDRKLLRFFVVRKEYQTSKRDPDWVYVHSLMQQKHQTLIQIWEEYRRVDPLNGYSYSQFTHHYRKYTSKLDLTMRQTHRAGECVFVDYAGMLIPYTNSETGETLYAQIFVGVLGCSDYTFAWASPSQKIEDWIDAHVRMFQFFGGVPEVIVPDNLKSAVTKAGVFPTITRPYLDLSQHYGCAILPARVRKPQDKSKAELGVLLVSRWISAPLRRREFFSIDEINNAIAELLPKLNERSFKRLPGSRKSRFQELDFPLLKPLPTEKYEVSAWVAEQKIGPDYHMNIDKHAYSVPYRLVAEKVEARVTAKTVEVIYNNQRVAIHVRSNVIGGYTTDPNHRPAKHQAYASLTYANFIKWASNIGLNAEAAIEAQYKDKPEYSLIAQKACSQLQQLAKLHGEDRLEAACHRAFEINSLTVKSIRSILQRRLDVTPLNVVPEQVQLPLHTNVRGPDYYLTTGGV